MIDITRAYREGATYAQALAGGWAGAGHSVTLGSRDPGSKTNLPFPVAGLAETARDADVVVNAALGGSSKVLFAGVDAGALAGKLIVDVANAVTPSFELVYPNSSLGEELQEVFPYARVVKTLNTCNTSVQADPKAIGPSSVFVSGDDADEGRGGGAPAGPGLAGGLDRGSGRPRGTPGRDSG